jgi:hypothetical protein
MTSVRQAVTKQWIQSVFDLWEARLRSSVLPWKWHVILSDSRWRLYGLNVLQSEFCLVIYWFVSWKSSQKQWHDLPWRCVEGMKVHSTVDFTARRGQGISLVTGSGEGRSLRPLQGSNPRRTVRIPSFIDDRDPGEVDVDYRDVCPWCGGNILCRIFCFVLKYWKQLNSSENSGEDG